MKRKPFVIIFVLAILICSMLLCFTAVMASDKFSDVPNNYWGIEYIETMTEAGIVEGMPNGSFRPEKTITYAEFLVMVCRLNGIDTEPQNNDEEWYEQAYKKGRIWMNIDEVSAVHQNKLTPLTRGAAIRILLRSMGITTPLKAEYLGISPFNDVDLSKTTSWYGIYNDNDFLYNAYILRIINGDGRGNANLNQQITRVEACKMLVASLNVGEKEALLVPHIIREGQLNIQFNCDSQNDIRAGYNFICSALDDMDNAVVEAIESTGARILITEESPDSYYVSSDGEIIGIYYPDQNRIVLFQTDVHPMFADPASTATHEFGHFIWYKMLTEDERQEVARLYSEGQAEVLAKYSGSTYCEKNVEEFWAELIKFLAIHNKRGLPENLVQDLQECIDVARPYVRMKK